MNTDEINEINQAIADGRLKIKDGKVYEVRKGWEPKGGCLLVGSDGHIFDDASSSGSRLYGSECDNMDHAQLLVILDRRFRRLYQYIREEAPNHDLRGSGYVIGGQKNRSANVWHTPSPSITDLTMPEEVSNKLCNMIENGEYKL